MSETIQKRRGILPLLLGGMMATGLALPAVGQDAGQDDSETSPAAITEDAGVPSALSDGVLVSRGNGAGVLHTLNRNGIYYISGKPSGGWTLREDHLCLVTIKGDVTCTDIPENAEPGLSWSSNDDASSPTSFALPGGSDTSDGEGDSG